jgi:hypothetical protein
MHSTLLPSRTPVKKTILIIVTILGFAAAAGAQPRAVGVKLGWGADISYQHTVNDNFIEVDLGLNNFNSLDFTVIYNCIIAQPEWTETGNWNFYIGPGAAMGMKMFGKENYFHIAAAAIVGFDYVFPFPLQLSFDVKPQLIVGFGHGFAWSMTPSIGVRYRF